MPSPWTTYRITRRATICTGVALAAALAGCATAGGGGGQPHDRSPLLQGSPSQLRAGAAAPARSSHNLIGADVLRLDPGRSLFDVVERVWPAVLRPALVPGRAARNSRDGVVGVYSRGVLLGGEEFLRTVRASDVVGLRRMSLGEEFGRFGRSHEGGALELVWRM